MIAVPTIAGLEKLVVNLRGLTSELSYKVHTWELLAKISMSYIKGGGASLLTCMITAVCFVQVAIQALPIITAIVTAPCAMLSNWV